MTAELPPVDLSIGEEDAIIDAIRDGELPSAVRVRLYALLRVFAALDTPGHQDQPAERQLHQQASDWQIACERWREFVAAWRDEACITTAAGGSTGAAASETGTRP